MPIDRLILDKESLERMGLHAKIIFLVEYDMHSEWVIPEDIPSEEAKWIAQRNKLARRFRNDLVYLLKYKFYATQHLQSCWIIEGKYLEMAITELEELKRKMKERGFNDADRRIRVIQIVTTPQDNKYYDDKKAGFLLRFIQEAFEYCNKAEQKGTMHKSTLWRCEKAYEIVSIMKEEIGTHESYKIIEEGLSKLEKRIEQIKPLVKEEEEDED